LIERLFAALGDAQPAADAGLPDTGLTLEWERQLSAAFIRTPDGRYGTRCSTLVISEVTAAGQVTHVIERSFETHRAVDAAGGPAHSVERRARLVHGLTEAATGAGSARLVPAGGRTDNGKQPLEPAHAWIVGPIIESITERVLPG
jgi:hypothetical protein